jgi:short subunit dehydrogenase-like uncharacterized protein
MPGRIVLYGATGYTGALTAQAMVAGGARPVLAGRDQSRLSALADRISQGSRLETAVAAAGDLRDLAGAGDVLVSAAGPFMKVGRPVVAAAADAGAVYLDSTGEPPFIREVFEEFGPRAERTGAVLLTAFGYDFVPGNLAGALALQAAGPAATRVRVGYFVRGDMRRGSSAGTRASATGVMLEPGYAFRGGRVVTERTAAHVASFALDGKRREAFSVGGSEHFGLPRLGPVTDVGVYLGWFGRATRLIHYSSVLTAPMRGIPGMRQMVDVSASRIQRTRTAPHADGIRSDVVAVASDAGGRDLARVHLAGGDPYSFTAAILAWAAAAAAAGGVRGTGALGPVEAFGLETLEKACAAAGFRRELPAGFP